MLTAGDPIDSCDFFEVKAKLLSCTCYKFTLQAVAKTGEASDLVQML
jgi:hypothetical protein